MAANSDPKGEGYMCHATSLDAVGISPRCEAMVPTLAHSSSCPPAHVAAQCFAYSTWEAPT